MLNIDKLSNQISNVRLLKIPEKDVSGNCSRLNTIVDSMQYVTLSLS